MRKERRKAVEASTEKEIEGERRWRLKREESRKSLTTTGTGRIVKRADEQIDY